MQRAASVGVSTESGRLAVLLAQLSDNHDKERRKAHVSSFQIAEVKIENAVARADEIRSGAMAQLVGTAVGSAIGVTCAVGQGAMAGAAAWGVRKQIRHHDDQNPLLKNSQPEGQAGSRDATEQTANTRATETGSPEQPLSGRQDARSRTEDREDTEAPGERSDLDRAQAENNRMADQNRAEYDKHLESWVQLSNSETQLWLNVAQAAGMMGNSLSQISNSVGELVKSGHDADRTILEGANEAISSFDKVNSDNMSYHTETSSKALDISSNIIRSLMA